MLELSAIPTLNMPRTTLLLAAIQSCVIEEKHPSLDICYYSRYGALDVIDIDLCSMSCQPHLQLKSLGDHR